jgi:ABC-2 type transport system ATP-binding protein
VVLDSPSFSCQNTGVIVQQRLDVPTHPQPQHVVQTRDLCKRFGQIQALSHASVGIGTGCTGLLGPNGAGKSTFIRLLLGLLQPDSGEAVVAGLSASDDPLALRAMIGYMPEHDCLPKDAKAQDFVRYMGELHGLPRRIAVQRANDTLYHVGLGEERFRPIGGFSTGMKQRVKLAQALVHDPKVLLLDEPTNGLDPAGRNEMLEIIQRIAHQMGIHVLLSSHLLADIERVADSVVIINAGRVVVQGTLSDLMTASSIVSVRTQASPVALARAVQARGIEVEIGATELQITYDSPAVYDAIRDAAVETGSSLTYLKRRVRSLEDVYLMGSATPAATASTQS